MKNLYFPITKNRLILGTGILGLLLVSFGLFVPGNTTFINQSIGKLRSSLFETPKDQNSEVVTKKGLKGENVILNDIGIVALSVNNYVPKNENLLPKKGDKLVLVDVIIENKGSQQVTIDPYNFILIGKDEVSYGYTISDTNPRITKRPILKGGSVKGYLSFEIPEKTVPATLIYKASPDAKERIAINLLN